MERLTYFEGGRWWVKTGDTEYSGPVADRLAAYEDTGLEPEEIKMALDGAVREFMEYDDLGAITRLRDLAQAEKDGRLVRHGRWIYNKKGNLYQCSVCLGYPSYIPVYCRISKYCPNCGAKMDFPEVALKKKEEADL